jgi:YD repeat-containing protein
MESYSGTANCKGILIVVAPAPQAADCFAGEYCSLRGGLCEDRFAAKSVESANKRPTLTNQGTVVSTTSQILNAAGQVLSSTGPDGQTTTFTYNALGQQTGSTLPNGGTTSTVYDALGRKVSQTDPNGLKTSYVYDAAGDLVQTIYADPDSGSSSSDTYMNIPI